MTPAKRGAAFAQLAALDEATAAANSRVRDIQQEAAQAQADAAAASERLVEAYAADDGAKREISKLTEEKTAAEARAAQPWSERVEGAERAANRKQTERDLWAAEHVGDLLAELKPDAVAVVDAMRARADELAGLYRQWHGIAQQAVAFVRLRGADPRTVPSDDATGTAIRDLGRLVSGLPLPLPHDAAMVSVPLHDDDPERIQAA